MNGTVLVLALLGDPTLPAGVPSTGGFNQTLSEFLCAMAGADFSLCVITDTSSYTSEKHLRISKNIELFRVTVTQEEHAEQENLRFAQRRILSEIYGILENNNYNIKLIHSFYWFSGYIAAVIRKERGVPFIQTPISLSYYKTATGHKANCSFQVECEPYYLKSADLILAITDQEKTVLVNQYMVSTDKVIVVGRSVSSVFKNPARDDNGIPRNTVMNIHPQNPFSDAFWWVSGAYLYVGRMVPIKGITDIVLAWIDLRNKYGNTTPPLWLVGGSPSQIINIRKDLLKKTEHLPTYELQNEIVWWGCLDQASISTLLLKTLALITHSRFEAGGRVLLEAMCQGRPVIATPNGFAVDLIQDWKNGFLVSYGDQKSLSHRMEHFIRQPYLAFALGKAAKKGFDSIEKQWNYINIHKIIYSHYLSGAELPVRIAANKSTSVLYTEEDGICLDRFPFFDTKYTRKEWLTRIKNLYNEAIASFRQVSEPDAQTRHYSFEINGVSYRIKQFYDRINRDAIWNGKECIKVLRASDMLIRAIDSQQFSCVLSCCSSSVNGAYYITPSLQKSDCVGYTEICSLLDNLRTESANCISSRCSKITESNEKDSPNYYRRTLKAFFSTLEESTNRLSFSDTFQILLSNLPKMRSLEDATRSEARMGINYGKPLRSHIVHSNGLAYFLPSSNWYWGELGPDYIYAAIETDSKIVSLPWQSRNIRQNLWLISIAWKELLQAEWERTKPPHVWETAIVTALNEVFSA